MKLEDLVTEALAPGTQDTVASSPTDIIRDNRMIEPGVLAELVGSAQTKIQKDHSTSWDLIAEIVAYQISSSLSSSPPGNALLLFHAEAASRGDGESLQWLQEKLQDLESRLLETAQKRRRSSTIGSFSASLDFLVGLFGDDAENQISSVTGARKPTVRKWIGGSAAQWSNSNKVMTVAKSLFILLEEKSWSEEEALEWFSSPLSGGKSPAELWAESSWYAPPELREELQRLGIDAN